MQKIITELNFLITNLQTMLPLANSHMVHFITHEMFENCIPKSIQDEIMALSIHELNCVVLDSFSNKFDHEKAPNLIGFLQRTQKLSLGKSVNCLSYGKLCDLLVSKRSTDCSFHITKNLMSDKKSHEVEIMSEIVAAIAKSQGCSHIVDIGGGKGYLSSILALKYQLNVLSIDSSTITSKGAEKQIPKVEKLWNIHKMKSFKSDNTSYTANRGSLEVKKNSSQLCKVATLFITEDTDVMELLKDNFEGEIGGIMLVGLHTCGNLAASSLRLFTKNPEHLRCLVNIGCCYHLIVEEFDTTPPWLEIESTASGIGFPMSAHLRDMGFVLGRNARMLAAQSLDRILHKGTLETEPLFYRALLESYFEKKLCKLNGVPHFRIGKMARKCSNFIEYAHKSIQRLGLNIVVDDNELQQLYECHSENKKRLHAFFLLRLAVAPAIEAAIMLDRLLYLKEQGIDDAYLTQLFDPVVSPRSFGIIGFNK